MAALEGHPDACRPSFTRDFTTCFCARWARLLERFAGRPDVHGVEIGCFEGRSSIWFLENILEHESSRLTCIDPWCPPAFSENIRPYRHKVRWVKEPSQIALRNPNFELNSVSFAYLDASPAAAHVLETTILLFPFLARGGILIFNCYLWESQTPQLPESMPKLAVDAFLRVFAPSVKVRHSGFQLALEKTVETDWT